MTPHPRACVEAAGDIEVFGRLQVYRTRTIAVMLSRLELSSEVYPNGLQGRAARRMRPVQGNAEADYGFGGVGARCAGVIPGLTRRSGMSWVSSKGGLQWHIQRCVAA